MKAFDTEDQAGEVLEAVISAMAGDRGMTTGDTISVTLCAIQVLAIEMFRQAAKEVDRGRDRREIALISAAKSQWLVDAATERIERLVVADRSNWLSRN